MNGLSWLIRCSIPRHEWNSNSNHHRGYHSTPWITKSKSGMRNLPRQPLDRPVENERNTPSITNITMNYLKMQYVSDTWMWRILVHSFVIMHVANFPWRGNCLSIVQCGKITIVIVRVRVRLVWEPSRHLHVQRRHGWWWWKCYHEMIHTLMCVLPRW